MYKYKDRHLVGQSANTRCQNLINRVQRKVNASAAKYNVAHRALEILTVRPEDGGWRAKLLPLAPEDIHPLRDKTDIKVEKKKKAKKAKKVAVAGVAVAGVAGQKVVSEGHMTLSWIWKVVGVSDNTEYRGVQECELNFFHFFVVDSYANDIIPVL